MNAARLKFLTLIAVSVLCVSMISFPDASAQNSNLFVSATSTGLNNYFYGPMVIEVKIKNNGTSAIEPEVYVDKNRLEMVQAKDDHWYGYFADKTMAEIADATTSVDGTGLDFGGICTVDEARISIFNSTNATLFNGASGVAISDPSCGDEFYKKNINVVRKAKEPIVNNTSIVQKNIVSGDAWPFIQLFDFDTEEPVKVKYFKETGTENSTLIFSSTNSDNVSMKLDRDGYSPDSHVRLTIRDLQLNIDPTDKDSWTWLTSGQGSLFYQFFDGQGGSDVDGTARAVDILPDLSETVDILPDLSGTIFNDTGKLFLYPYEIGFPTVVNLRNNDLQQILVPGDIASAHSEGDSLPAGSQPMTFLESKANSGNFTNSVLNGPSNLTVSPGAQSGNYAWVEYDDVWHAILILDSDLFTPAKMTWNKHEYSKNATAILTIIDPDMNKNSEEIDSIYVSIHSRANPGGIELKMDETEKNSGSFMERIKISESTEANKELLVFEEDNIRASYFDEMQGGGITFLEKDAMIKKTDSGPEPEPQLESTEPQLESTEPEPQLESTEPEPQLESTEPEPQLESTEPEPQLE